MEQKETIFKEALRKYLIDNNQSEFCLKAALIDMDGVLYDTMPKHAAAWYRMSKELGLTCEQNEFFAYEGMTGYATINLLYKRAFGREVSRDEAAELYKKKAQYFIELGEPELMPGAAKMLGELKASAVKCVLVTGSGQHSVITRIQHDYPNVFSDMITAHDVQHGKPNPEPYIKGQEKAGVQVNQAMVIENAPLGVEAGHKAGCFTIAVATGPIPEDELRASGADLVFDSMPQFAEELPLLINILCKA